MTNGPRPYGVQARLRWWNPSEGVVALGVCVARDAGRILGRRWVGSHESDVAGSVCGHPRVDDQGGWLNATSKARHPGCPEFCAGARSSQGW